MHRAALGLFLLAAALPLTACGGATPELEGVASAAEKVEQANTYRFAFSWDEPYAAGGEGAVDLAGNRFLLRMALEESRGDSVTGTVEMRLVDGVIYMKNPEFASISGKPWIKLDDVPGSVDLPDPSQALAVLRSAADFEPLGQERVRGVQTTHYRGTVEEHVKGITPAGSLVDAWVDADEYLRRMGFKDGAATLSIDFYDFGADVNIEVPHGDEVATIEELGKEGDQIVVELESAEDED